MARATCRPELSHSLDLSYKQQSPFLPQSKTREENEARPAVFDRFPPYSPLAHGRTSKNEDCHHINSLYVLIH